MGISGMRTEKHWSLKKEGIVSTAKWPQMSTEMGSGEAPAGMVSSTVLQGGGAQKVADPDLRGCRCGGCM